MLHIPEGIQIRLCHRQKFLRLRRLADTVPHNKGKIRRRRVMFALIVRRIQSVGRDKMCILASNLFRLLVHLSGKRLHRPGNSLRDHHRRVVERFQHQRIQKIFHNKLLPLPDSQMHLWLPRRPRRRCHHLLHIPLLQRENTGHDLCGARHRQRYCLVLSIQDPSRIPVQKAGGFGIQILRRRLFRRNCLSVPQKHSLNRHHSSQQPCQQPFSHLFLFHFTPP